MKPEFFGLGLPHAGAHALKGRLIVIEGPDCVGRSTHIRLLQDWLEGMGYGVVTTSLCRSELAEAGLSKAKRGIQTSRQTLALFYATDMADRMERVILPALESGFIVLSDRYVYTLFARNTLRGVDPNWLRKVYGFALVPHLALYLDVTLDALAERALKANKMDFWECGMDLNLSADLYESFMLYQEKMLLQFDRLVEEYGLIRVNAMGGIPVVNERLRGHIQAMLDAKDSESLEEAPAVLTERGATD